MSTPIRILMLYLVFFMWAGTAAFAQNGAAIQWPNGKDFVPRAIRQDFEIMYKNVQEVHYDLFAHRNKAYDSLYNKQLASIRSTMSGNGGLTLRLNKNTEHNASCGLNAIRPIPSRKQPSIYLPEKESILDWMQENHVPTVGIGILKKGKVQQVKVFGNLKAHTPAPENTLFNMASLTKPIVSVLTLQLISTGKWQLDEPLYHYWIDPDVAADSRHEKLTTRHILSHQSGLPNWRGHEPGGKLAFAFEPGTQSQYSGEGFEYLRQALERKFKIPIETLAASLVFKPNGMTDTRFYWDASMDGSRYADRYHADGTPYPTETWDTANAANLLLTTVKDYGQFGVAVMKRAGLSKEVYGEMIKAQYPAKNGENAWGLGWRLVQGLSNGEYALVHTGRNPGVNTIILLLPESQRGMVVFTNGENGDNVYRKIIGGAFPIGKEIVERIQ